jgi:hypothetical protein
MYPPKPTIVIADEFPPGIWILDALRRHCEWYLRTSSSTIKCSTADDCPWRILCLCYTTLQKATPGLLYQNTIYSPNADVADNPLIYTHVNGDENNFGRHCSFSHYSSRTCGTEKVEEKEDLWSKLEMNMVTM